jgi:hypothetical protein
MVILFRSFKIIWQRFLNYKRIWLSSLFTMWILFQKRVVCNKLNIYVFFSFCFVCHSHLPLLCIQIFTWIALLALTICDNIIVLFNIYISDNTNLIIKNLRLLSIHWFNWSTSASINGVYYVLATEVCWWSDPLCFNLLNNKYFIRRRKTTQPDIHSNQINHLLNQNNKKSLQAFYANV